MARLGDPENLYLWDLDGTIIDSSGDLARAVNALLADHGLDPLEQGVVISHVGRGARHLVAQCLAERGHTLDGEVDHDRAVARFQEHYRRALIIDTYVYPPLDATLRTLAREGRRLGVVSNKPEVPTREILDQLDLTACFGAIVGGDTLPVRKPDPAPLQLAWRTIAPELDADHVVMIGDTSIDVETARRAGVSVCGVGWGLGDQEDAHRAGPDWWFRSPDELSAILLGKPYEP